MLIGYVSNERYLALGGVLIEFEREGESTEVTSRATGAIYAEIKSGHYKVTLRKNGYGPKSVKIDVVSDNPYHFRLLSNKLSGYMWPKWIQSGERSEFKVHSTEAYRLDLYRYGWKKEHIRTAITHRQELNGTHKDSIKILITLNSLKVRKDQDCTTCTQRPRVENFSPFHG